ncbi:hypothetical protein [Natranaerofaba carboxydovora]|uniref:hypothetical protein n=1 Tax=Natranaerofaba carboxydovora TaxID=2742683 RepID=UPI001F12BE48|nr:hypothetical protein [Natranaerofaba carboxydovora]UMZ73645.1 hypothetical protein ACONDI_01208 [Natranaerofaba carboxydovora]
MITKVMKNKRIEFRCDVCEKPIITRYNNSKELVCSCGFLHDISKLTCNSTNGRNKKFKNNYFK